MNGPAKDHLYDLLPAVYRMADARQGKPLRALLRVIEEEMNGLEGDIEGLYDDWFIETCADWVIPYIGDLLGIEGMQYISGGWNLRSYVANALAYRRRKGTAAVLDKVAHDVTGWPAHSVEFFRLTAATQNMKHLRPAILQSPNLKDSALMDSSEGPFGTIPHTVDVRKIDEGRCRYNISNIGIFLWRLQSYEVDMVNARRIDEGCYTFDPAGLDLPLFHQPKYDGVEKLLDDQSDIPGPLCFGPLRRELEVCQRNPASLSTPLLRYFSDPPVISIKLELEKTIEALEKTREVMPVPLEDLEICDLSHWQEDPRSGIGEQKARVAVDPHLGRLRISRKMLSSFRQNLQKVDGVLVNYSYGFSGDIGAGPYDRTLPIREVMGKKVDWRAYVTRHRDLAGDGHNYSTLTEALKEWKNFTDSEMQTRDRTKTDNENQDSSGPKNRGSDVEEEQDLIKRKVGLITIMNSRTYQEDVNIEIPEGCQLLVVAANFPQSYELKKSREKSRFSAGMLRPHIWGNINVYGTAKAESENPGELIINGLLIEGELMVQEGNLGSLIVANSTIIPGKGGIKVYSQENKTNDWLKLALNQSICGKIELAKSVPMLLIRECIIDAQSPDELAINAEGAQTNIEESTILGKSRINSLQASDCIFTGLVASRQKQVGYVRFSYLPIGAGSRTPRRFQCQPETFLAKESDKIMEKEDGSFEDALISKMYTFINKIHPAFNSLHYPDPAYAQLSTSCPKEISAGAKDGSEMGVFKSLQQSQRLANLDAALREYLPIELDAGIFFMT